MPGELYQLPIANGADVAPLISSTPEPSRKPSPDFKLGGGLAGSASMSVFKALKLLRIGSRVQVGVGLWDRRIEGHGLLLRIEPFVPAIAVPISKRLAIAAFKESTGWVPRSSTLLLGTLATGHPHKLECEIATVVCWMHDLIALGLAMKLNNYCISESVAQLEKSLHALHDRRP